ncbi:MAG: glycosyltransferase family 4 protein [Sporichthyaceae bacterium]
MRVLVAADYFLPGYRAGGAVRTLSRLVPFETAHHTLEVVTRDRDLGCAERFTLDEQAAAAREAGCAVHYLNTRSVRGLWALLRTAGSRRFDAVYFNSLWSPVFTLLPLAALLLRRGRRPLLLVAPRGELNPGALAVKSFKKRVVGAVLRRALAYHRVMWHVSSQEEAASLRAWLGERPARIVTAADHACPPDAGPSRGTESGPLRVVCVTRIVPVKDVRRLFEVLTLCRENLDVHLFGPVEDEAYWASCQDLIAALPANICFAYEGVLEHGAVAEAYRGADATLFPTRGENFGHVIAEALAVGCPVATTPTTFWTGHLAAGAGLVFEHDVAAAAWLDQIARRSPALRAGVRRRAWEIYGEWYAQSLAAPSLFAAMEDTGPFRFPRQRTASDSEQSVAAREDA